MAIARPAVAQTVLRADPGRATAPQSTTPRRLALLDRWRRGHVCPPAWAVHASIAALALELVDLEDPVEVGGELTYEVRVVNQGSCPCTNIQITATVPEGLLPREATGPSAHRLQGPQIVFEPLPKLATKADVVYRMKARGVQPGDYRFQVQMTCDQLRQPVHKEESSRVYKDGL